MTWRVGVDRDLPVETGNWDGASAAQGVWDAARNADGEIDASRAKRAFLLYDDDAAASKTTAGYKLPVARRRQDGSLVAVAEGLRNALSRAPQVEGVDRAEIERAQSVARDLLDKYNRQQGDSLDILSLFGVREDADPHADLLARRGEQWCALSADGTRVLGCYDTEDQARERLRQVEAAVAAKSDGARVVSRCDYLGPIRYIPDGDEGAKIELELEPSEFAARLTPEGYLKIEGAISGTGVYSYSDGEQTWGELRTADEVFHPDSLASFQMVPVTDDHPSEMVKADNIAELQRGHLGSNVRKSADGMHVVADMLITNPGLIDKIKAGKMQLSNGYEAVVEPRAGVTEDGVSYQAVQTQIRGNHTAVVDLARGGPSCRLLFDAVGVITNKETTMTVKIKDGKIMIGETEHEVPDEVAAAFEEMRRKVEEQGAELSKLSAEGDAPAAADAKDSLDILKLFGAEPKADKKTQIAGLLQGMQAKIDTLEAALTTERTRSHEKIDARVALVTKAREILGAEFVTDSVSDVAIMKAVVAKVMPNMAAKVAASKSDEYVRACFDAALEHRTSTTDSSAQLMELSFNAARGDTKEPDLDALYQAHCDRLGGRVEQKEAN